MQDSMRIARGRVWVVVTTWIVSLGIGAPEARAGAPGEFRAPFLSLCDESCPILL